MTEKLMTSCGIRPYFSICPFASLESSRFRPAFYNIQHVKTVCVYKKMNCAFCVCLTSPRDFVKPMSLVMDDHGSQPHARSSGLRYVGELSFGLPAVISCVFYLSVKSFRTKFVLQQKYLSECTITLLFRRRNYKIDEV